MTAKWTVAFLLILFSAALRAEDKKLTISFDETPIERVLQALAEFQQLNLMVAPGVTGQLSLRLHDVPWQQALELVARMGRLTIETEGNVLVAYPESWLHQQQLQAQQQREDQLQQQALMTRNVMLRYADAATVHGSLLAERATLLSPRGSATVDSRTNAILLRDVPANIKEAERWIQALDTPLEQIELSAQIVTISEDHLRELGVKWGWQGDDAIEKALRNPQLGIDLGVANPAITAGLTLGRLNGQLLNLELSALEQENQIDIIASPRLFTSHQQPASIKQGTEIPYEVSNGNNGATTIEFKEAVLGMEVTPSVQGNGRILLKLRLSQNVPGRNLHSGDTEILTIDKQEIETQVMLKDGQTLALGGIFQQQRASGRNKVPLLGDIPVLGALFRYDIQEQKRRELVIFITPRLVREE
ncbi:DNA uptake porin HofQ [Duffyella gerundensis]|uniref:DNA uptake porin HofQ n=1 Tax=Duffyella gerundensis TaxID=1619313 RepID=UPI0021F74550|nr:DNA uptake porin HofQ [Duffyella gerundensis]